MSDEYDLWLYKWKWLWYEGMREMRVMVVGYKDISNDKAIEDSDPA